MILCMTEKPDVAKTIAKILNATKRMDGYFEGNGYIVTWCVGHLVGLAEPDLYNEEWGKFNKDYLPMIPDDFKTVVLEKTKNQFNVVKKLINRTDVEKIIDMGDNDPQGLYLQWLVRTKAGNKKPVQKFIVDDYTEETVLKALNQLEDINKFRLIIESEFCKAKTDWEIGMNFSRWFTNNVKNKYTVGRVQTPTLNLIAERYLENKNFKPQDYYQITVGFREGFSCMYKTDTDEKRIFNMSEALEIKNRLYKAKTGILTKYKTEHKKTKPPKLYNIDDLEKDGVLQFGYTPKEVLQVAQSLYEKHKVTTYPRAESKYITQALEPELRKRISYILEREEYKEFAKFDFSNFGKRIVDDSKIEAHHGIIVTDKIKDFDFSSLSVKEKNILNMIISRILIATSEDMEYDETQIEVTCNTDILTSSSNLITKQGFKEIQAKLSKTKDSSDKTMSVLNTSLKEGQTVFINSVNCETKKTTPPKLHTEATILTAMANASNSVDDEEDKELLNENGIGTKATRAEIINKLFGVEYIEYFGTGKVKNIIPTQKGLKALEIFPDELKSAHLTAECEKMARQIQNNEINENDYMLVINNKIRNLFNELRADTNGVQTKFLEESKQNTQENVYEKISLGNCPYCNKNVYESKNSFYCEDNPYFNKDKENKECKFIITKNNRLITMKLGKDIEAKEMKKLLSPRGLNITVKAGRFSYTLNFKISELYNETYHSVQFVTTKVNLK